MRYYKVINTVEQNRIGKLVESSGGGRRKCIWVVQDGLIEKIGV